MSLADDHARLNDQRADYARAAVKAYEDAVYAGPLDAMTEAANTVTDLLCDLRHYLDRHPEYGTFAAAVDQSQTHYDAETGGEE
jgi:hypothetical protein